MDTKIQGHGTEKVTHVQLHRLYVSESSQCDLVITVLASTKSGWVVCVCKCVCVWGGGCWGMGA